MRRLPTLHMADASTLRPIDRPPQFIASHTEPQRSYGHIPTVASCFGLNEFCFSFKHAQITKKP